MAVRTGLEPATSCVTGRHSNQLNYRTIMKLMSEGDRPCQSLTDNQMPMTPTGFEPVLPP